MSQRGYHVSRDPTCYGCGDPSRWGQDVKVAHWCADCKAPIRFPWDERASAVVPELTPRQQELRSAVYAEPSPMWLTGI